GFLLPDAFCKSAGAWRGEGKRLGDDEEFRAPCRTDVRSGTRAARIVHGIARSDGSGQGEFRAFTERICLCVAYVPRRGRGFGGRAGGDFAVLLAVLGNRRAAEECQAGSPDL